MYFTPTEGHLSPLPLQTSPIHINYINDGELASGYSDSWKSLRSSAKREHFAGKRNSFTMPRDYLEEADEVTPNFIIPDPIYTDVDRFQDVIDSPSLSMISIDSAAAEQSMKRRRKRYKDRRSRQSVENEAFLLQEIEYDSSKGARPKIYSFHSYRKPEDLEASSSALKSHSTSLSSIKKVNSQVNIDEKTGRVTETPADDHYDLTTNIDVDEKKTNLKFIKMQPSSSLPDLQAVGSSSPSSSDTTTSNSNNQMPTEGHGKHVILTVTQNDETMNQIDCAPDDHVRKRMKLNIGIASNASSSSTSSNNLESGNVSNTSTL